MTTRTDTPLLTIPDRLARGDLLISDGATGTYLRALVQALRG